MIPNLYNRKLRLLEILTASWRIYTANFKFLLLFVFLLNFFAFRINYSLVVWSGLKVSLPFWIPARWNIHIFFVSFINALSTVFVIQITEDATKNECVIIRSAHRILRRFLPTIAICFIFMILQLIIFLPALIFHRIDLFKIGAIILTSGMTLIYLTFLVYTAFVYPAMILANKSAVSAFFYSFRMVFGRWWKILWAWVVITLPAGFVCFLIQKFLLHFNLVEIGQHTISQHALWSLYSLVNSFSIIGITVLFLNIDGKKEVPDSVNPINPVKKFP